MQTQTMAGEKLSEQKKRDIAAIAQRYHEHPHQLMRILMDVQKITFNSIPREVATIISGETGIPEAELYEYISFYAMISPNPRGRFLVRMCESAPCHVTGARAVMRAIIQTLGIQPGETSADGMFTLEYCQCLGVCVQSPAILVNDKVYKDLTPGRAAALMEDYQRGDME